MRGRDNDEEVPHPKDYSAEDETGVETTSGRAKPRITASGAHQGGGEASPQAVERHLE